MRLKKIEFITPFLLVLLNLVVKILFISTNSLGGDEPFSVYHAQMDLASIVHQLSTGNNPPLYEILLHFWIKIFGISEFSVRLPSVLFSAFAVVYIFKIGKDFFSFQVGLVAALLFSFSNFNLLLAHEARVYAMLTFFTSLSMYYFLLLLRNPATIRYHVTILVANTILIYSHYFGFFIIAIQALSVFFFQKCRRTISRNYLVVLSGVLVLYIPNIPIVVTRFLDSAAHGTWVAAPDGMDSIYNMLRTFSNQPLTTVVCCVLLVLSVFGLVVNTGSRQTEKKIIVLWFLFPFAFMFAFSYWLPIFFDRYLIFVSLGYYLLLAIIAVYVLQRKSYSYALSCILVMLYLVTFNPDKDNKRHVKETITKIKELKDVNTSVILSPSYFALNFCYYYDRRIFTDVDCETVYGKMFTSLEKEHIYAINSRSAVPVESKRVLYLDAEARIPYPDNKTFKALRARYKLVNTYKFYEIFTLYEFEML